jgi:transposase
MSFVGVDLHTNSFTACRREAEGSESFETFTLSPADLDRFCLTLDADDEIAFEATGNSAWFRDQVLPCAGRVVVVNPSQFKVIRQSVKKTDRNDARALALFLAKDMLPETRAKTQAASELGSLTQTRDLLVKQRTRLLNKIHALHNRHGIRLKRETLASRKRLLGLAPDPFTPLEWAELEILRDQALSLTEAIAKIDARIEEAAGAMNGCEGLTSIKGIGARAAAVFLSTIGNVHDFASADKLAAYFGIVPRVSQSNETDNRGGSPSAAARSPAPCSSNARSSPPAIRPISKPITTASRRAGGPARRSSRPPANSSQSSTTHSKTSGSSGTSQPSS